MKARFIWGRGRHATPEERVQALEAYYQSGLTQREFAGRHRMQLSTLGRWLRAGLAKRERGQAVQFHSLALPPATTVWSVEVQKAGGTTIRFHQECSPGLAEAVLKSVR